MILIVGGAGYIGAHINKQLNLNGYETLVFDNLSYGHEDFIKWGTFERGDLGNIEDIRKIFEKYPITAVMHFAAFTFVGESVEDPQRYYRNNVCNTLTCCRLCLNLMLRSWFFPLPVQPMEILWRYLLLNNIHKIL